MAARDNNKIHTGTIIENDNITLEQVCQLCETNADWVFSLIQESIIEPEPFSNDTPGLHFSGNSLIRIRSAMRLHRDLGVNLEGVALILDLLDELAGLRSQLHGHEQEWR